MPSLACRAPPVAHEQVAQDRRASWRKFGEAATERAADSVTSQTPDEVQLERIQRQKQTQEEKSKAADFKAAMAGSDKSAIVGACVGGRMERGQGQGQRRGRACQRLRRSRLRPPRACPPLCPGSLRDMLYKKRMERQLLAAKGLIAAPERPPDEDGHGGSLPQAGAGSKGGWVPPSLRNRLGGEGGGGEMMQKRRNENSVRVSNLSEDVTEDDLAELFGPFGPIQRIFVAKDRETGAPRVGAMRAGVAGIAAAAARGGGGTARASTPAAAPPHLSSVPQHRPCPTSPSLKTGESRGFAFINFIHREDANRAISKLDGFGYDSLILSVSMAAPRPERPQ